jgi:septal ring factor EnvC (AmiA/AmiB activator)
MNRCILSVTGIWLTLLLVFSSATASGQQPQAEAAGQTGTPAAQAGNQGPSEYEKQALDKIEQLEQERREAEQALRALQRRKTQTREALEQKQKEAKRLERKIRDFDRIIRGRKKELSIYRWNLEKKFPRQRDKLLSERQEIVEKESRVNRAVNALARGAIVWPADRNSPQARRSVLCRVALQRALPDIIEMKKGFDREHKQINQALAKIDQDIQSIKQDWMPIAERRIESVSQSRTSQKKTFEKSAEEVEKARQELKRLEAEERTLVSLITDMKEKLPLLKEGIEYQAFVDLKGSLPRPIGGEVVHGFGKRRHSSFDIEINNQGLDYAAELADPVRAVADGQVVFRGTLPGYGPLVMLHHGMDYFTFYTPVASDNVEEGQWVKRGEVIGRVTQSQTQGPSVLHFEIRHGEKAVDPREWLRPEGPR